MAAGTLYTYPDNFRAHKILIAAKFNGVNIKTADVVLGQTNKTPEFLKKFPLGKVPAYEASNGTCLFESNAIAHYVASDALRGANPEAAAQVQQWVNFADNEITPAALTWVYPCLGIMQFNKQNTERAKGEIKKALAVLNQHLEHHTFLVGERISLADITTACNLLAVYKLVLDPEFRAPFPNVTRWFLTVVNQPQAKGVLGEVKLCEKMAQFDAKKFQELQGGSKKQDQKKPQPKQEKKQEKKEKPKKEAADEEDDVPKEKPSKDPFAALPKGKLVMDEWKKMYSNEDTIPTALPWFWEHFDPEHYSVWYCEYKYPDELSKVFMTCNLVAGMFQRLDRMRKHSFGSMCIFGEDKKNQISGLWFWLGNELAFELSPDLQIDYASYEWKKLDYNSPETKKMITEYFAWEGDFEKMGGMKFNQGKIFK